ncbi:MAG: hypothetical protein L0G70_07195 [Rubrobacter sp.]|nr:hypothetical protein [Rubrobacter sp.]
MEKTERQNVTVSVSSALVRQARIIAAERGTSVSAMLSAMLEELVESEHGYRQAEQRSLALLAEGFDLGTSGEIGISREELHERGV